MRFLIFLALFLFSPLAASAMDVKNNQWVYNCRTDPMNDLELCSVYYVTDIHSDYQIVIMIAGIPEEGLQLPDGKGARYFFSTEHIKHHCRSAEMRVDKNESMEIGCYDAKLKDDDVFQQMQAGKEILIRLKNNLNETGINKIPLKGFKEAWDKLVEITEEKSKGKQSE